MQNTNQSVSVRAARPVGPIRRRPGRLDVSGWGVAVLADVAAIAIYVVVGRSSHHESLSAGGLLTTSWPFLVGLAGGYVPVAVTGWPASALRAGAAVLTKTVILGLVLRFAVAHDGTPFPYIVVTVIVLAVLMMGWRLVARVAVRNRA